MNTKMYDCKADNLAENGVEEKELPNIFSCDDCGFGLFIVASAVFHVLFVALLGLTIFVLKLLGISFLTLTPPDANNRDIEFVLTQKEAEPINKNTPYRSDRNSQAGGIHDPNKKVSEPSPAPAAKPVQKVVQQSAPQPQPVKKQQVQKPVAPAVKPQPKTQVQQKPQPQPQAQPKQAKEQPKAPQRPSKVVAPVQKPVLKPSSSIPKAQAPKLSTAPSSPFKITTPPSSAPVGKGFSASSGSSSSGGSRAASGGAGSGMPAPQFSTTRVAGSGGYGSSSRPSSAAGKGGYGTGNMGNPGPGNPKGAPGVDAVKSPQWGPYMRELESKIKRNWFPPKGDQSKRVVLLFKIGRKGELLSVRVSKPSGSPANDQAAVKAVQMSAPFRSLPVEYTGSSVEIEFTFDYNVLGANTYR